MPLTTRFFWGDIDHQVVSRGLLEPSEGKHQGFYTVRHFMEGSSMPGSEVLCIRDWRAAPQPPANR